MSDLNEGGGGGGTVKMVAGQEPNEAGEIDLNVSDITYAADIRDKVQSITTENEASEVKFLTPKLLSVSAPPPTKLVVPVITGNPIVTAVVGATANTAQFVRVTIPITGTLHDLAIFIKAKVEGKLIGGVYDCGDANATEYTRLSVGSEFTAEENAWNVIHDPNLAVKRGQQLMFGCNFKAASEFGRGGSGLLSNGNVAQLPTGFQVAAGGNLPKLSASRAVGAFELPAKITEANMVVSNSAAVIIARVS